jgi:2-iminobutanoate/2-iminopropanoate deaminase
MRTVIQPADMPAANPTYSQAIQSGGFIFFSGQIGTDPKTGRLVADDIAAQARQALDNTAAILKAAGSPMENVVSASLFLTEFDQLSQVNRVYEQYFPANGPAKMSCGVSQLYGGAKFEIQVIATSG